MTQNTILTKDLKQRLTAFVEPTLIKRAKIRGALEGLTISEVVEKALEEYTPKIEKDSDQHIHLKFIKNPSADTTASDNERAVTKKVAKHTKTLAVPR